MAIQWIAPEFEYHKKDDGWFVAVVLVAILVGLFALWQQNFLFLIFDVLATIMIIIWGKEKPKTVNCELDEGGLHIKKAFYGYEIFSDLAIKPGSLAFKNKTKLRPLLTIHFPREKTEEIKAYLLDFLSEMEYSDSLVDSFSRYFKF